MLAVLDKMVSKVPGNFPRSSRLSALLWFFKCPGSPPTGTVCLVVLPSVDSLPASGNEDSLHLVFLENSFRVGRCVRLCE